ncbi:MAG: hypothetical protein Ct9H300mP12_03300 [Acidimicrobiales bacterium]|nr:MAG: hypothetical protein Ct9H300mP12_03300 [Acidimicrobiales bacterium]
MAVPLGRIAGARSGDKGGDANLGLFVRDDAAWAWMDRHLTVDRLRDYSPRRPTCPSNGTVYQPFDRSTS